jgi:hypothetical protein
MEEEGGRRGMHGGDTNRKTHGAWGRGAWPGSDLSSSPAACSFWTRTWLPSSPPASSWRSPTCSRRATAWTLLEPASARASKVLPRQQRMFPPLRGEAPGSTAHVLWAAEQRKGVAAALFMAALGERIGLLRADCPEAVSNAPWFSHPPPSSCARSSHMAAPPPPPPSQEPSRSTATSAA